MTQLATALFLGVTLVSPSSAVLAAQPCVAMCGVQEDACVQTARVTKLACTETCRATSDPTSRGLCMRGCSSAFRTARTNCRFAQRGCVEGCGTPAGAPGCVARCGDDLAACVAGVTGMARDCLEGCRAAGDPRACVGACTAGLRAGTAACRSALNACKTGCTGGSPCGAFPAA